MPTIGDMQAFIIALVIGLLIGLERERRHPEGYETMGVRTFMLIALLGALAAHFNQLVLTVTLSAFVFVLIIVGYLRATPQRKDQQNIGLTTEVSAAVVFCLGFLADKSPLLAAILGGIVLLLLVERRRLHTFARHKLQAREIEVGVTLAIFAVGVLPFLPNTTIDPWQIFNPQRFGILVLMIAVLQFGGHVAIRIFGQRLGMIITGFFGGFVSSTAVFATLPTTVREHPELTYPAAAAAILATVGMLIELALVLAVASPQLFLNVLWPLMAMIVTGVVTALFVILLTKRGQQVASHPTKPMDFKFLVKISLLIGGMIFLVALVKHYLGVRGIEVLAFLSGFFDLHSISLAIATLNEQAKLTLPSAHLGLALALFASYLSKLGLLWSIARNRFSVITTLLLLSMMTAGAVTYGLIY